MNLKTILFIAFSASSSFSLLSPVFDNAPGQSREPGDYFSKFRHRDIKDPSEWHYNNHVDEQRPTMNRFKPHIDGKTRMDKFRGPDGDHLSRISEMQKPHNEQLVKNDNLEELLLDRVMPSHYDEYVDDDYNSDSDYQRGMFNVYFPDGRPQNVNFEEKIVKHSQY